MSNVLSGVSISSKVKTPKRCYFELKHEEIQHQFEGSLGLLLSLSTALLFLVEETISL